MTRLLASPQPKVGTARKPRLNRLSSPLFPEITLDKKHGSLSQCASATKSMPLWSTAPVPGEAQPEPVGHVVDDGVRVAHLAIRLARRLEPGQRQPRDVGGERHPTLQPQRDAHGEGVQHAPEHLAVLRHADLQQHGPAEFVGGQGDVPRAPADGEAVGAGLPFVGYRMERSRSARGTASE